MCNLQTDAKAIFLDALDCLGVDELKSFLEQTCGSDAALRLQVETLIRAHRSAGAFLGGAGAIDDSPTLPPDTRVGPYLLREQIGEGGMGLVFVADQETPVRRRVALKIVKPGMDSRQVLARFEAERHALALMDHPNIAKVLDAGVTESGRPYFVMELVRGVPITEYCDAARLTPRQRLELFLPVCRAIQHAHQKGVIHRDIKPSNLLVTLYDSHPVPKVIDFGIAKAVGSAFADHSVYTGFAQLVGTPMYMSPEQAEMTAQDVDTRADVYALGVVLYELLTGTTPFDGETLRQAGFDEMRRIIREDEPAKPSQRVTTMSAEKQSTVSGQRGLDGRQLGRQLQGGLDWVVMTCLAKDRTRRYESAGALAADIERFLRDEPVTACPPSTSYRLRTFTRRNRTGLVAGGLVAAALVGGTGVSIWQAFKAWEAQRQAETDRDRAGAAEQQSAAINEFLQRDLLSQGDMFQLDYPFESNLTVKQALQRASATINDRFHDKPLVEAAIRLTIAKAYRGRGENQLSIHHLERSAELLRVHLGPNHPDTLTSTFYLAEIYSVTGRRPEAIALLEKVVEQRRAVLGPDHDLTLLAMTRLGGTVQLDGKLDRAEQLIGHVVERRKATRGLDDPETANCMHDLGLVYRDQGRFAKAIDLLEFASKKLEVGFGAVYCNTIGCKDDLAALYWRIGERDKALSLREEILKAVEARNGPQDPSVLNNIRTLVHAYQEVGRFDLAEPLLRKLLERG
ncbi:MAG TPA: serine/threonine-protein kinase, partial [Fimbriiglobus sp.]